MATKFKRELRLLKSTLEVSKTRDVSGTISGKHLQSKGFVSKKGLITSKGKKAIKLL